MQEDPAAKRVSAPALGAAILALFLLAVWSLTAGGPDHGLQPRLHDSLVDGDDSVALEMLNEGRVLYAIWVVAEVADQVRLLMLPNQGIPAADCAGLITRALEVGGEVARGFYRRTYETLPVEAKKWLPTP